MARLGSWWLVKQDVEEGEQVRWSRNANRFQGNRGVGGKLFCTDRRLLFSPHRFDGVLGGKTFSVPLAQIAGVDKEPKGSGKQGAFGGGLRDRLRLRLADGREELCVRNELDQVIAELYAAAGGSRNAAAPPSPPGA